MHALDTRLAARHGQNLVAGSASNSPITALDVLKGTRRREVASIPRPKWVGIVEGVGLLARSPLDDGANVESPVWSWRKTEQIRMCLRRRPTEQEYSSCARTKTRFVPLTRSCTSRAILSQRF